MSDPQPAVAPTSDAGRHVLDLRRGRFVEAWMSLFAMFMGLILIVDIAMTPLVGPRSHPRDLMDLGVCVLMALTITTVKRRRTRSGKSA